MVTLQWHNTIGPRIIHRSPRFQESKSDVFWESSSWSGEASGQLERGVFTKHGCVRSVKSCQIKNLMKQVSAIFVQ